MINPNELPWNIKVPEFLVFTTIKSIDSTSIDNVAIFSGQSDLRGRIMNTGFQPVLSMNVIIVVVILRILLVVVVVMLVNVVIAIVTVIRMIVGCGFTVRFVDNNHCGTVNVRNRRLDRGGTFRVFPRRVSIFHETRSLAWRWQSRRAISFASLRALVSLWKTWAPPFPAFLRFRNIGRNVTTLYLVQRYARLEPSNFGIVVANGRFLRARNYRFWLDSRFLARPSRRSVNVAYRFLAYRRSLTRRGCSIEGAFFRGRMFEQRHRVTRARAILFLSR